MPKHLLLTGIGWMFALSVQGQAHYHHNVVWGRLALTDTISARLRWELFVQGRRQSTEAGSLNALAAPQFASVWPWLTYAIRPTLRVGLSPLGYFQSWLLIANPSEIDRPGVAELRVALRLDQEQRFRRLTYTNRYALERRWRDLANNGTYLPNWRARYQARLDVPLRATWLRRPLSLTVFDEIFIQFGRAVRANPNVFDQNRVYGGLTYGLARNVRASLGYIYQVQQRNSGREFDHAHVLFGVLTFDHVFSQFRKARPAAPPTP